MSRPVPEILLELKTVYGAEQVYKVEKYYGLLYDGQPIGYRETSEFGLRIKYKKATHTTIGHALSMSRRLNKKYNTNLFTVHELIVGEKIHDPETKQ